MTNFDLLMGGPAFLQGIGAGAFPFLQPAIEPHHPGLASEIIKGVQVNKMPNYFRSATGHYSFPGMYTVLLPLIPALYIKSSCLQLKISRK